MGFGEATPLPLDTADGFTVGRDDLTPPRWNRVKESYKMVLKRHRMVQNGTKVTFCVVLCVYYHSVPFY